jgi:hypothetical protein
MSEAAPPCAICQESLGTGALAKSPTCPCQYHTACLLERAQHIVHYHPYYEIVCPTCQSLLQPAIEHSVLTHDTQMAAAETANAQILTNAAFKTDLKATKAKRAAARKAVVAYSKAARAAKKAWLEQNQQIVSELKATREQAITSFKETDIYKTWRSATKASTLAQARIITKYNLSRAQARLLFGARGYRRWYYNGPMLKYLFWLRI